MPTELVVPATNKARLPKPPALIEKNPQAVAYWNDYWKHGVSTLWTSSEHPQVARLSLMMAALHRVTADSEATSRINVQIAKLEKVLFLSPESRKYNHILIEAEAPQTISSRRGDLAERLAKKSA